MPTRFQASALVSACLLSACSFMPPAPPVPGDLPRIAINQTAPRLVAPLVTATAAPAPTISVATTPPVLDANKADAAPFLPMPDAPEPNQAPPNDTAASVSTEANVVAQATAATQATENVKTVDVAEDEPTQAPPAARVWHLSPADRTVRQALTRWAVAENWTFGPDQWRVDWDIPIEASAEFHGETFEAAVQALAASIALTEAPVNTCFYGNRVLRIIPYNQSCNRTTSHMPQS